MATKPKKPAIAAVVPIASEKAKAMAQFALRPSINAAAVVQEYGKPLGPQDLGALVEVLAESMEQVQGGNLKQCEAMLMGQAQALQAIFMNFSRRTLEQEYQAHFESFFRMAMRAQNQCRMTLETLATIKNPPVVFARQANIATGHQQINNGMPPPSRAHEIETEQIQLSGETDGLLTDARASCDASRVDQELEAVGKIDRTKVNGR